MDVIEAILNRKSIRYFKPHTIPQKEEIHRAETLRR